jgi:hypothetical protein
MRSFLLRLVGAYVALTVALVIFERPAARATAPLARAGLALFASDLHVRRLDVDDGRLVADVATSRPKPGGAPGTQTVQLTVAANARTLLVAPLLTLALLGAWGFGSRRAWAVALATAAATTLLVLAVDLANGFSAGVAEALGQRHGAAIFVRFLLDNGGRQALALLIAAAAAWVAQESPRRRAARAAEVLPPAAPAAAPAPRRGRRRRALATR